MQYRIQHRAYPEPLIFSTTKPCFRKIDLTSLSPSGESGSRSPMEFFISLRAIRKSICKSDGRESVGKSESGIGRSKIS